MSLLLWTSDPRPPPLSYETPSLFLQIIFYSARMLNLTKSSHVAVTHWNVAMCCSYLHYVLLSSMGMTVNLLRYLEQKYKFIKCSTRKLWCSSTWFYKKKNTFSDRQSVFSVWEWTGVSDVQWNSLKKSLVTTDDLRTSHWVTTSRTRNWQS